MQTILFLGLQSDIPEKAYDVARQTLFCTSLTSPHKHFKTYTDINNYNDSTIPCS